MFYNIIITLIYGIVLVSLFLLSNNSWNTDRKFVAQNFMSINLLPATVRTWQTLTGLFLMMSSYFYSHRSFLGFSLRYCVVFVRSTNHFFFIKTISLGYQLWMEGGGGWEILILHSRVVVDCYSTLCRSHWLFVDCLHRNWAHELIHLYTYKALLVEYLFTQTCDGL